MRGLIRHFAIDIFSLWLATRIASGIFLERGTYTLLSAGVVLALVSLLARPVINLLLLPINLITFGLFRWVSSAITLYITTLIIPSFKILQFYYPGYDSKWIYIPEINFRGFLAYVAFAFIISTVASFLHWLSK